MQTSVLNLKKSQMVHKTNRVDIFWTWKVNSRVARCRKSTSLPEMNIFSWRNYVHFLDYTVSFMKQLIVPIKGSMWFTSFCAEFEIYLFQAINFSCTKKGSHLQERVVTPFIRTRLIFHNRLSVFKWQSAVKKEQKKLHNWILWILQAI